MQTSAPGEVRDPAILRLGWCFEPEAWQQLQILSFGAMTMQTSAPGEVKGQATLMLGLRPEPEAMQQLQILSFDE